MHNTEYVVVIISNRMRIRARGWGAAAPLTRAKPLLFGQKQKLHFSGKASSQKWKNIYILYLLNKKRNSFRLARHSARNPEFLLIINGWGESGKVIFQGSIAVFRAVSKKFGQRWLSPLEKIGPYAYVSNGSML